MGLVKSEYRAGVYDAQHFKDHTLNDISLTMDAESLLTAHLMQFGPA